MVYLGHFDGAFYNFSSSKENRMTNYCVLGHQGAIWQTIAYIFRVLSIQNPASLGNYAGWFVLILVWLAFHYLDPQT